MSGRFTLIAMQAHPEDDHALSSPRQDTLREFGQGYHRDRFSRPTTVLFDPQGQPIAFIDTHARRWTTITDDEDDEDSRSFLEDLRALQAANPARSPITNQENPA